MRPVGNLACGDSSHGRLWSTCSPAHTWSYVHLARRTPHRSQPRGGLTVRRTPQRSQPRDGLTVARAVTGGTSSAVSELRSEEHTSELQSRGHLVCRLLLEKKNKRGEHDITLKRLDRFLSRGWR